MAQLTDLEKVRKSRLWKKRIRGGLKFLAFSAIVFGISLFVYHKGNLDLRTAVNDAAAELTAGTGFPVSVPSGKLSAMESMDGALMVTTDSNIYTYNSTGRRLLDKQHGMVTPTTSVAGGRFLLYDRGGKRAEVYSRSSSMYSLELDYPVYDSDLARSGNFAIASGSDRFLSQVLVYNEQGVNFYQCFYSDRPAVTVSLADNKDTMVVGLLDVRDGEYFSTILRYQFQIKEASEKVELAEEMLLNLSYEDGDTVRIISDRRAANMNSSLKEQESYSFDEWTLVRFYRGSDGKLLLYLRQDTGTKKGRIVLLDKHLRETCSIQVPEDTVRGMRMDENSIYIWREDGMLSYNFSGKETARAFISDMQMFYPMDGQLYYATSNELCALPVKELGQKEQIESVSSTVSNTPDMSGPSISEEENSNDIIVSDDAIEDTATSKGNSQASSSQPSRWDLVKEAIVGSSFEESSSGNISSESSTEKGESSEAASSEGSLPEKMQELVQASEDTSGTLE